MKLDVLYYINKDFVPFYHIENFIHCDATYYDYDIYSTTILRENSTMRKAEDNEKYWDLKCIVDPKTIKKDLIKYG